MRPLLSCSHLNGENNSPQSKFYTIVSRGDWLGKSANIKVESNGVVVLCWKLSDRAQSFVFCSQIVIE